MTPILFVVIHMLQIDYHIRHTVYALQNNA